MTTSASRSAKAVIEDARTIIQRRWRQALKHHQQKDYHGQPPLALIVPEDEYELVFGQSTNTSFYGTPVYPRNRCAAAPRLP